VVAQPAGPSSPKVRLRDALSGDSDFGGSATNRCAVGCGAQSVRIAAPRSHGDRGSRGGILGSGTTVSPCPPPRTPAAGESQEATRRRLLLSRSSPSPDKCSPSHPLKTPTWQKALPEKDSRAESTPGNRRPPRKRPRKHPSAVPENIHPPKKRSRKRPSERKDPSKRLSGKEKAPGKDFPVKKSLPETTPGKQSTPGKGFPEGKALPKTTLREAKRPRERLSGKESERTPQTAEWAHSSSSPKGRKKPFKGQLPRKTRKIASQNKSLAPANPSSKAAGRSIMTGFPHT